MWFKNRRAKFRKKQRSLQKEQLQRLKEAGEEGSLEEGKEEAPPPESQAPPSPSVGGGPTCPPPCELSEEVNVTSPEQSGAESGAEDLTDREDESLSFHNETKEEGPPMMTDNSSPNSCKPVSPKSGAYLYITVLAKNVLIDMRVNDAIIVIFG